MVIAGDFNDWRRKGDRTLTDELGVYEVFEEVKGRPARTFPSMMPDVPPRPHLRARPRRDRRSRTLRVSRPAACPITPRSPRRSRSRASEGRGRRGRPKRGPLIVIRFTPGNAIDLLRSGGEFFPALTAAIDDARREIWLETYIFADDAAGKRDRRCAGARGASRRRRARARRRLGRPALSDASARARAARRRRASPEVPPGGRAVAVPLASAAPHASQAVPRRQRGRVRRRHQRHRRHEHAAPEAAAPRLRRARARPAARADRADDAAAVGAGRAGAARAQRSAAVSRRDRRCARAARRSRSS